MNLSIDEFYRQYEATGKIPLDDDVRELLRARALTRNQYYELAPRQKAKLSLLQSKHCVRVVEYHLFAPLVSLEDAVFAVPEAANQP